jgi:hypothetical protein
LDGLPLTDAVVPNLAQFKQLNRLYLRSTKITADGVAKLHEALPGCQITWDVGVVEPTAEAADPDRQAAEWIVRRGNQFGYRSSREEVVMVTSAEAIPKSAFKIESVKLGTGSAPTEAEFASLKGLEKLDNFSINMTLTRNQLDQLDQLPLFPHLEYLNLTSPNLTDQDLEFLPRMPVLKRLGLHHSPITNAAGLHIEQRKELRWLLLQGTKVDDGILEHVAKLKKLDRLNLSSTSVSDEGLPRLQGSLALRILSLNDTKVTEAGIKKLAAALPNCQIEWDGGVVGPEMPAESND